MQVRNLKGSKSDQRWGQIISSKQRRAEDGKQHHEAGQVDQASTRRQRKSTVKLKSVKERRFCIQGQTECQAGETGMLNHCKQPYNNSKETSRKGSRPRSPSFIWGAHKHTHTIFHRAGTTNILYN